MSAGQEELLYKAAWAVGVSEVKRIGGVGSSFLTNVQNEEDLTPNLSGLTPENFHSYKAKIRKDLEKGFGLYALGELAIESVGKKPDTRYGINMDKSKIRIIF